MRCVAAVVPGTGPTGPIRQLVASAAGLETRGYRLRVLMLQRPDAPVGELPATLSARRIEHAVVEDSGPLDFAISARLRKRLLEWQADIVQTHGYKPTAAVRQLRVSTKIAWVGFYHGSTAESLRAHVYHWLDRRLLLGADRVVVMSKDQRDLFPSGRLVRIIYNAVRATDPVAETGTFPALDGTPHPRLAVVGRLSREKGVDLFLDALARLRERGIPTTGVIIGDGPLRDALAARAQSLDLGGGAVFLGQLPSADGVYPFVDMLVIPSRSEGLPNVLLEALNADLPIVATRVGAVPDVLEHPRAGVLVEPGSVAALAAGLEEALGDLDNAELAGGRREAVQRFSQANRDDALAKLYEEVLAAAADPVGGEAVR